MSTAKSGRGPYFKICVLVAGLIPLVCFNITLIPAHKVAASDDAVKWTRVNIPTEGEAGGWGLAEGSDIQHLTLASDGNLYACVEGLTYTLYNSTDGGVSWSHIGKVQDAIVDIAISPNDASSIYYATSSTVYRSTNGGQTFHSLPAIPAGPSENNTEITSIDITWLNNNIIAAGTRDTDSSEFGGIYTLDEADIVPSWTDTDVGSYDVYAVAFSPNYSSDHQLVAVVTDETDTFVTSKIGNTGWGKDIGDARLDKDNSGSPTPLANSATIAFPGNYDAEASSGSCAYFVAIDSGTGEGDVYKINCAEAPGNSLAIDLNAGSIHGLDNIDITGLAACGDNPVVSLLAGAADNARTYLSLDGGKSWTTSRKQPTGESCTCLLMTSDFMNTGVAYAATSGGGSALSISRDRGETWNQLSLIDTAIDFIVDLAPSPNYSQDNTLFMLTFGGEHSLWRSLNSTHTWERVLASALANVDNMKMVGLPPQYGDNIQTVFVAGESNGRPAIWESTDNGQNYRCRFTQDPDTGSPFPIDTWAIADETSLFVGSYDGSNGLVYRTTNSGFIYSEGVPAGSQPLNSLVLSPDYEQDESVLAGNTNGWIYRSDNNGASFGPLPADAASPPLTDSVAVAFDPGFKQNNTIYAASDTADSGVYRFIIGTSTDWENINSTLPGGAMLNQLVLVNDSVLYAANSDADGGMERCLNPTFSLGPTFETVTRGLSDGVTLSGLWQNDHRLWSIDTTNIRLMTFNDTLTAPVTLISPDNQASGTGNLIDHTIKNISLDWETLEGTTSYQWQLDYETDFSSVPDGFEDNTQGSSTRLPTLEPATTYYWRVRASAPVLSPWSDKWSFTTSLDTGTVSLKLESPTAGAIEVPVKPVFQWTSVVGADTYELLISADADFAKPVVIKNADYALTSNVWRCDVSLDYDTTYYWKVRAINSNTLSAWSAAGAFTTESAPVDEATGKVAELTLPSPAEPPETAPPSPEILSPPPATPSPMRVTPPPSSQATVPAPDNVPSTTIPNWMIYVVGALLLTIILALITILTMVLKMRRF